MSNSRTYRGNPAIYASRARIVERQEADLAAATEALAEAEARAAEELPAALVEAGVIVPGRRRPSRVAPEPAPEPDGEPEPTPEVEQEHEPWQ
jgi:hypothetical protein